MIAIVDHASCLSLITSLQNKCFAVLRVPPLSCDMEIKTPSAPVVMFGLTGPECKAPQQSSCNIHNYVYIFKKNALKWSNRNPNWGGSQTKFTNKSLNSGTLWRMTWGATEQKAVESPRETRLAHKKIQGQSEQKYTSETDKLSPTTGSTKTENTHEGGEGTEGRWDMKGGADDYKSRKQDKDRNRN